jgi:hypothetical protein
MERLLLESRRIIVRLTADRRRFGLLCLLTAVAVMFWARLVLVNRTSQASAATQVTEVIEVAAIDDAPPPAVPVMEPERPRRDPFSVDGAFFPIVQQSISGSQGSPKLGSGTSDLNAEVASRLRLGATLPPRVAVIDGITLRVGQPLSGLDSAHFELVEVHRRKVIVEAQGRRFVLRME